MAVDRIVVLAPVSRRKRYGPRPLIVTGTTIREVLETKSKFTSAARSGRPQPIMTQRRMQRTIVFCIGINNSGTTSGELSESCFQNTELVRVSCHHGFSPR
jgi:hypothetical protein